MVVGSACNLKLREGEEDLRLLSRGDPVDHGFGAPFKRAADAVEMAVTTTHRISPGLDPRVDHLEVFVSGCHCKCGQQGGDSGEQGEWPGECVRVNHGVESVDPMRWSQRLS